MRHLCKSSLVALLAGLGLSLLLAAAALAGTSSGNAREYYERSPDKRGYLELAKRGWSYELRTTMVGRDLSIPVHINGRDMAQSDLCLVGEAPRRSTLTAINAFRSLFGDVFGKEVRMVYAGPSASRCGSDHMVVLRLYSGWPSSEALSEDINWLNDRFQLGLPRGRAYTANSPAFAQTFFGRRGQATHIMVPQASDPASALSHAYHRSLLVEELYQAYSFGMDVPVFDLEPGFLSKLQEYPVNPHRLMWNSPAFMQALASSNPVGLCPFDLFMLHAVAQTHVDQTNNDDFITFIAQDFEHLVALTRESLDSGAYDSILSRDCAPFKG